MEDMLHILSVFLNFNKRQRKTTSHFSGNYIFKQENAHPISLTAYKSFLGSFEEKFHFWKSNPKICLL